MKNLLASLVVVAFCAVASDASGGRPCQNNEDCGPHECCLQSFHGGKMTESCQSRAQLGQRCSPLPKYDGMPGKPDYYYNRCPCVSEAMACRYAFDPNTTDDYEFYSSIMDPGSVKQVMDMLHGRCLPRERK